MRSLERIERNGTLRDLRAFVASDRFARDIAAVKPNLRFQALSLAARIETKFKRQIGPLLHVTPTKAYKWDEVMIARLRKAEAMYGNDEDIARALRVTYPAAQRARLRYCGSRVNSADATRGNTRMAA